ncbi:MAG: hypothetical protein A3F15_02675 [Candidatus Wildermuthbacteria bacterium RIFCSPHIGHO2_12_FULL_40_12]|uniref:Uncharacterized protein n=1 Tax=Candidatus Wildermuthbacteria bacterium RIFCSPHIGHO2_12_FULL_40_12 TaxID=1802457 RepID=A0A1G2RCR4_9BACT|nr:MAG: hypothetical protein A3F15_02675 [Candidatus Wildermuthbacteria bacterium RIFCSPHIGHO2_12_FULL_40_12]
MESRYGLNISILDIFLSTATNHIVPAIFIARIIQVTPIPPSSLGNIFKAKKLSRAERRTKKFL